MLEPLPLKRKSQLSSWSHSMCRTRKKLNCSKSKILRARSESSPNLRMEWCTSSLMVCYHLEYGHIMPSSIMILYILIPRWRWMWLPSVIRTRGLWPTCSRLCPPVQVMAASQAKLSLTSVLRPDSVRRRGQSCPRVRPADGRRPARAGGPGDGGRVSARGVPPRQCGRHHQIPAGAPWRRPRNVIILTDTAWKTQNTWELCVPKSYSW